MALSDDIVKAKAAAIRRVLAGGMKDNLHMAQVVAAEQVVIDDLHRHQREHRLLPLESKPLETPATPDPSTVAGTAATAGEPLAPEAEEPEVKKPAVDDPPPEA